MSEEAMSYLARVPIIFQGFRSDMATLMKCGWKFHTTSQSYNMSTAIAISNDAFEIGSILCDESLFERRYDHPIHFKTINHYHHHFAVDLAKGDSMTVFQVLKARDIVHPAIWGLDVETTSIGDHARSYTSSFQSVTLAHLLQIEKKPQKTKELIVDINEVQSLLDQVVRLQRPAQQKIRDNMVKETQCSIVSFVDLKAGMK